MPNLKEEIALSGSMIILTLFLWVNFDPLVAAVTFAMYALYWIGIGSNRLGRVEVIRSGDKLKAIFGISIVAFAAWVVLANTIIGYVEPSAKFSLFSTEVFQKLATKTDIPILSHDPAIRFIAYGVDIPIAESVFFLSFLVLVYTRFFKIPVAWNIHNPRVIWVIALVGMTAAVFHFTVRRFSEFALFTDFAFFAISAALVFWRKSMAAAILFHIYTNSAVLLAGAS